MKITVNPGMEYLRQFVRQLPELFPASGEVLHDGRNQIRAFDIGGERLVVKRYKRPSAFNAVMYSFFPQEQGPPRLRTRPAPARAGNRHARTRRMERIPPQRADNGDLFRIPPIGLHTAHGGYGTVPDLRSLPVLEAFSRSPSGSTKKGSATRISTRPTSSGGTTRRRDATISS